MLYMYKQTLFVSDDICAMVLETIEETDVSQVVPLKKIQR